MADEPKPSATVVVLRDAAERPELLLLQRAPSQSKPGPWVFPGGRVEPHDIVDGAARSVESARLAAVRETEEEAGLPLAGDELVAISRWITPPIAPKRFDTWFFLGAVAPDLPVRVDGGEIVDHRWLGAEAALLAHDEGDIRLAPPTFVTVTWLLEFERAADAIATLPAREFVTFEPRICRGEAGAVMLYPGDAGYETADPDVPGARHRVHANERWRYRYERSR
jgi:8-oxo-dGTP pyrophosphatase MutT (NUDIX family)